MSDTKNQGSVEDLSGGEAIKKLKELSESQICMFCTYTGNEPKARPMYTAQVDEEGTIWFISSKDSNKYWEIKNDDDVFLTYAVTSKEHYLAVHGKATISTDKAKIDELWSPYADAWFDNGKDDPNVSLLSIAPGDCHYWDTKHGKLVNTFKIAVKMITGTKTKDDGVEGSLSV